MPPDKPRGQPTDDPGAAEPRATTPAEPAPDSAAPLSEPRAEHQATLLGDGVSLRLEIEVPAATVQKEVEHAVGSLRNRVRMRGFRRGKAPSGMIRQQFRDEIQRHVLDQLIPRYVSQELRARELNPIDAPRLDRVDFEPDAPLRFVVRFDVAPEVETVHIDNVRAVRRPAEVNDDMLERAIGRLRERAAELLPLPAEATAEAGDFARLNIKLMPRDGKGKRLAEENRFVQLGNEQEIPALNEHLAGLHAGEQRRFLTQLSESYPNALLASKEVTCEIEVQEIKRRQLPAVDDEFAKDLGFDGLVALRDHTTTELHRHAEEASERDVDQQLLASLRTANPVEVPPSLVDRRLDETMERVARELAQQGVDPREGVDWAAFRAEQKTPAEQSIAEEILLDHLAQQEDLKVSELEVDEEIRRRLQDSEGGKTGSLASIRQQMRRMGPTRYCAPRCYDVWLWNT